MDVRLDNCLKNQGLTLADTATMTDRELLRIPNFGLKCLGLLRLAEPARRPVPEITPEMIEAGVKAFFPFDRRYDEIDDALKRVWRAMEGARRE